MKEDFKLNKKLLVSLSKDDIQLSSESHNYTKEQIRDIQSVIEKGLTLYKSKLEIMAVLKNVDVDVVNLMFQKLEQKNPKFFTAYLIRLAFMKQVEVFNDLVYKQHTLLKQYRMDMSVFEKMFSLFDSSTMSSQDPSSIQQRIHAHLRGSANRDNNPSTSSQQPSLPHSQLSNRPKPPSSMQQPDNPSNSNFSMIPQANTAFYPSSQNSQPQQQQQHAQDMFNSGNTRISPSSSPSSRVQQHSLHGNHRSPST